MTDNEYLTPEYALAYLAKADGIPHRTEGEAVLLSFVPKTSQRILDLGTGDGRLLALLHAHCPEAELVGLDFSPTMLAAAQARFAGDARVSIRAHDLNEPLPADPPFDAIVSSFAIHHCPMLANGRSTRRFTTCCYRAASSAIWNMLPRQRLPSTHAS